MEKPAQLGPYRIVRQLGEGGMGAVFEAVHDAIERRVAIKVLKPEFASNTEVTTRFFNEARAVNRIEHPSLVQISDYGHTPDGTAYIVMEFLKGETLAQRLASVKTLPVAEALAVTGQVATALAAAHEKGIVHRDLKPENIMLVPDPVAPGGERAKVLDFGIAKLIEHSQQSQTGTSVLLGTPSYMSTEQCKGAKDVDGKTDVYSLGVILYRMLAGRLPFVAASAGELVGQHLFKQPEPISTYAPQLPAELVQLVHKLLEKDRAQRPTMAEVATQLARLTAVRSGSPEKSARDAGPGSRLWPLLVGGTALAVALVGWRLYSGPASGGGVQAGLEAARDLAAAESPKAAREDLRPAGMAEAAARPAEPGPAEHPTASRPSSRVAPPAKEEIKPAPTARDDEIEAIGVDPKERLNQSIHLLELGLYARAIELANEPRVIAENATQAYRVIGVSACRTSRAALANEAYAKTDGRGRQEIQRTCQARGLKITATAAEAADSEPEKLLGTAKLAYKAGMYQKALELAQKARAGDIPPAAAWRVIGAAACQLGDGGTASQAYEKADADGQREITETCQKNKLVRGADGRFAKP